MTDISVSERRLSAALDRIDQLLEAGVYRRAGSDTPSDDTPPQPATDAALAEAARRIAAATDQATRLAAANDDLAAANRILIDAASGQGDRVEAVSIALEAEIEALRAARAAEIAQLGDIMQELERLMAGDADRAAEMDGGN